MARRTRITARQPYKRKPDPVFVPPTDRAKLVEVNSDNSKALWQEGERWYVTRRNGEMLLESDDAAMRQRFLIADGNLS